VSKLSSNVNKFSLALILTLIAGCGASGPALERFDEPGSEWVPLGPAVVESMTGTRDGTDVQATAIVASGDNRVTLNVELHLDPPARFVAGTHESVIAGESFQGKITADSVDFLGGQSTASSVGGIYRLESPEGILYRVRIPATELNAR
jgi:hypothetical protein